MYQIRLVKLDKGAKRPNVGSFLLIFPIEKTMISHMNVPPLGDSWQSMLTRWQFKFGLESMSQCR